MTTIKFKKLNIEAYKPGKSAIRKLKKIIENSRKLSNELKILYTAINK